MMVITDIIRDKKARIALWSLSIFSIIIGILLIYFVLAAHVVTTSGGGTSFNINEDGGYIFNITVNNTDTDAVANISQVNITLPTGFMYVTASNGSDAAPDSFVNTTNTLSWTNNSLILNATRRNFWFNASASTPGTYNITIISVNATAAFYSNISITVNDTTTPSSIDFVSPSSGNGVNISTYLIYNITATDGVGIQAIVVRLYNSSNNQIKNSSSSSSPLSGNFSGLADGVYYINASANDSAGNTNYSTTRKINVDATYPLIAYGSVGNDVNGANITRTNIFVNVTLTEANSVNVTFTLHNATASLNVTTFTVSRLEYNWTGLSDGAYTYNITARDGAGNANTTATRTITIDTGGPVVTINLPASPGINLSTSSVNFNVTLNENGACAYSLDDGINNITMQNNGNRDFNATNNSIGDGSWTANYYCNDTAGNWNRTASRIFGIDTMKPLIAYGSVGNDVNGANITRTNIFVNVTLTEANSVNVTFTLHNATASLNVTTFTVSRLEYNWTGLSDGAYTYNITARDGAGNANTTATRAIRIDRTAPSINFASPSPGNGSILSTFSINISSSDAGVGIGRIRIKVYNSSNSEVNNVTSTSNNSLYVTFSGLSGVHYVNASVNDTLGNINYSSSRTYTLTATSFEFNGTAKDENGNRVNNSVINITVRNQQGWTVAGYVYTTTNASGWFNISVPLNNQWVYESSIVHFNGTFADFRSKSMPAFPSMMMQMLGGTTYYLAPAGTINITAVNSSGGRITFQYQVKDTQLGYPIASNFDSQVSEAVLYVPRNKNYSIMLYPNQNMPVSFNWNNFTSTNSYSFNYASSYNATTKTLHKQFNITTSLPRVSGYINYSGLKGWDEFTIVPYLLEGGNMVHAVHGDLPYNLSSGAGSTDRYTLSTGFFNISLPATAESSTMILFATARNGTRYMGGFRNISLSYSDYPNGGELANFHFTNVTGLLGTADNISMSRIDGGANINITAAKQSFRLANGSGAIIGNTSAHIEVTVDYSSFGAIEFTWMTDIAQSDSVSLFLIPHLNNTGIKEMNVFASGGSGGQGDNREYSPKRVAFTAAHAFTNTTNITMNFFNPGDIDGALAAGQITVGLYISNSTCDVPSPPGSCILGDSQMEETMSEFNPMQAIMGGGKVSFRMGTGNISVHYVNVDMMASGPPDALFDRSTTNATSGNSFDAALRFGSGGPTIYDYVLISIPYSETAGVGLNDSAQVNASIPVFYDDNWNVVWNASNNGTNINAFAANYSHYNARQSEWQYLLNRTTCGTSQTGLNATNPCFINTTNNRIWIRLPHFSGTGPSITGSAVPAAATTTTTSSSSSGSGTTSSGNWTNTFAQDKKEFSEVETYNKQFSAKQRVRLNISGETHYVGVTEVTTTTATVEVSSSPQQAVLKAGEEKKFDVTSDGKYDLLVKLNKIVGKKADITITYIQEIIAAAAEEEPTPTPTTTTPTTTATLSPAESSNSESWLSNNWVWIVLGIIVIVVVVIGVIIYKQKK